MLEDHPITTRLRRYRLSRDIRQDHFAIELGISKARLSQIEKGMGVASVALALKIEHLTGGEISASELCPTVALVREADRATASQQAQ